MDDTLRARLVSRILAGHLLFRPSNGYPEGKGPFLISTPSRLHRAIAEEVFAEAYEDGVLDGLYTEEGLRAFLSEVGHWTAPQETSLARLVKDMEDLKVAIFENSYRSSAQNLARKALTQTREAHLALLGQKHAYDHQSAVGHATLARTRYLTAVSLFRADGSCVYPDDCCWEATSTLVDDALSFIAQHRLEDGEMRELARTEPWQTTWRARRGGDALLGQATADYSDEQKSLVSWSLTFDNIHEHPECPPTAVLEDDDALDGWLILQKRKREADNLQRKADALVEANPHLQGAGEIFLVAQSPQDVADIEALNDAEASARKRQKLAHVQKKGLVNEIDLPDVQNELRMQAVRLQSEAMRR